MTYYLLGLGLRLIIFVDMQEVDGVTYEREENLWVVCGALEAKKVVSGLILALMMLSRHG